MDGGWWWPWIVFAAGATQLGVGIGLYIWVFLRAWLWRLRNPQVTPAPYEDLHNRAAGPIAGFVLCLCWPMAVVMAVYHRLRFGRW